MALNEVITAKDMKGPRCGTVLLETEEDNGGEEDGMPRSLTASGKEDSKVKRWPPAAEDDARQGALNPNRAGLKPFRLGQDAELE